ncbi:hypothetical protein QBC35DRAFT_487925 [Podospora australis]|uniref:Uncharacterized protein n=1 Tax=Podospora australis TaxID=1536484 RepID=A0AAN6X4P2_9PEZI|nr:hypothetical protein QBC35DRAFT_487925 [Podospora australis]
MCGPETPSHTPRVGARVDFHSRTPGQGVLGNLVFLNPSTPSSSQATHVRFFSPSASPCSSRSSTPDIEDRQDQVLVSIHVSGDLTKSVQDSGLLQQFTLPSESPHNDRDGYEIPLRESLSLNVGEGIIGRRVSMTRGDELLADGIVGFNFLPPVASCL